MTDPGSNVALASAAAGLLREHGTGVVTDALTRLGLHGWMQGVLPAAPNGRVLGPAVTVRYGPRRGADRLDMTLYEVIRDLEPGSVLVIAAERTRTSVLGGNIARCGEVQKLAGIVTDGHCRDYLEIASLEMPVFCAGPTNMLPHDIELVGRNAPISCGGAQVNPGDLIFGDGDGVLIIPSGQIETVLRDLEFVIAIETQLAHAVSSEAPLGTIKDILRRKKRG
jgi:4-hydroxy-4-methyl-2-oxoglutarate aldolase